MADDLHTGESEREDDGPPSLEDMVNDVLDGVGTEQQEERVAPARYITARMAGEDVRALVARTLIFTGEDALANIRLTFCDGWVQAFAGDGYVMAIQKMRCEADTDGVPAVLMLTSYDAGRIAGIVPKPRKDEVLDDVTLTFVTGGGDQQSRPVNAIYQEPGRVASYACEAAKQGPPMPAIILGNLNHHTAEEARFQIRPEFLVCVAKASTAARDQVPYNGVRFYVTEERPSKQAVEKMIPGPIVAQFSCVTGHDNFVAVLMPFAHEWAEGDELTDVVRRIDDLGGAGKRIHPKPTYGDEAAS